METKTYTHRYLKYYDTNELGTTIRARRIDAEDPLTVLKFYRDEMGISCEKWWVEETVSTVKTFSSDEVEGQAATQGTCADCGHPRHKHNTGRSGTPMFYTSCFEKNGHDIYCDCQAFTLLATRAQCKSGQSEGSCKAADCLVHGWVKKP